MATSETTKATEQRLEQKLQKLDLTQEVDDRLGEAFEYAAIPMIATNIMGDLIRANQAFCNLLGYSETYLKKPGRMQEMVHPEDQVLCNQWGDEAVYEGRDEFQVEIRYHAREGNWIQFAVSSRTMRDEDGDALWFFTQQVDITPLKDAERALSKQADQLTKTNKELETADRLKTSFLATTTHDLRAPITTIYGFARLLMTHGDKLKPEDQQRYLELITGQCERLDHMLEDLLVISRLQSGKLKVHPERINLASILPQILENLDLENVELRIEPDLCVYVDAYHLERILTNLLTNAKKYGNGEIILEGKDMGNPCAEIRVLDNGDGVPREFVRNLFEPFTQAAKNSADRERGTGLGLAIVKGLAQTAGGEAFYEPRKQGGSVFGIRLPICRSSS